MKNDNKVIITEHKLQELKSELAALKREKKELGRSLEQARLSDVSEDTDAINAVVGEMQKIEQKITDTIDTIDNAKILNKKACSNKIQIGSEVKVRVNGKDITYMIVSDVEADPLKNKISNNSPVGKALIKSKVGATVEITIAGNKVKYEILEIC